MAELTQLEQELKTLIDRREQMDVAMTIKDTPDPIVCDCSLANGEPSHMRRYYKNTKREPPRPNRRGPCNRQEGHTERSSNWLSKFMTDIFTQRTLTVEEKWEYLEKYGTDRDRHDFYASQCFDACPNICGKLCGKPGCREGWMYGR